MTQNAYVEMFKCIFMYSFADKCYRKYSKIIMIMIKKINKPKITTAFVCLRTETEEIMKITKVQTAFK